MTAADRVPGPEAVLPMDSFQALCQFSGRLLRSDAGSSPARRVISRARADQETTAGAIRQAGKQVSMGRKKLFSLIEIAVAMAVAAIGVAAIMALLPIAVKSTSDSVGDTLAADAANTVIAQLDRAAWEHFEWIQNLKTSKAAISPFTESKARDYANTKLDAESYKIEPLTGLQDGHFAFLFGPPNEAADFAAEVICWKEQPANMKLTTFNAKTGRIESDFGVTILLSFVTNRKLAPPVSST